MVQALSLGVSGQVVPGGSLVTLTNVRLREIVARAYGIPVTLERFLLTGGADEILSARFDIRARPPENALPGETLLMVRTLLAERFGLNVHTEAGTTRTASRKA